MGLPAYYGSITSTILGYLICAFICFSFLNKKYKVDYEETIKTLVDVTTAVIIMTIVLLLFKVLKPHSTPSRLLNILIVIMYAVIGGIIYLVITIKSGTLYNVFGKDIIKNIIKKRGLI